MAETGWKIGELAKRAGLTVRMLRHYDRIGLFSPSRHTESGHRLYTWDDLHKLQLILSLKQLGFRLEQIKSMMDDPNFDARSILELQIARCDEQIGALTELRLRLQRIYDDYRSGRMDSGEQFLTMIRLMSLAQSPHFKADQIDALKSRYARLTQSAKHAASVRQMLADFERFRAAGTPPDAKEVAALARRWKKEMDELALADERWIRSAERYYAERPEEGRAYGMSRELYLYIKQAVSLIP